MFEATRRDALRTASLGAVGLAMGGSAAANAQESVLVPPTLAGAHKPRPLRFDPARLTGLSERLITSHWENNYQGSVRGLNTIETRLAAALADADYPPVAYGGLKREQLHRSGSVVLHEIYFDGLGGNGQPGGTLAIALALAFGGMDMWERDFRRTAMSLAGGSGWCILAYNRHMGCLQNYWAWDHMHGAITGVPLIALDMYEHAFHMEYGAAAARYVDAFMANLDWEVAEARYLGATA